MNVKARLVTLTIILAPLLVVALSASDVGQQRGFIAWLRDRVGLRQSAYNNLARVRNPSERMAGTRLLRYSLATEQESVLSECGECWSPLMLDDARLAVLKPDGIWEISLSRQAPRRVVPASGLVSLVARYDSTATQLLALQAAPTACRADSAQVRLVDLRTARVEAPPDSLNGCVSPAEAVNQDRVRNARALVTTDPGSSGYRRPRSIKVGFFETETDTVLTYRELSVRLDGSPDGLDRFDPIWLDDSTVVYTVRRLW